MNAIDYVKQNGIEKAKIHLEKMKAERWINSFFNDLKQIVDAFELVEYCYGLSDAKELLEEINSEKWVYNLYTNTVISVDYAPSEDMCIRYNVLEKAINLVEQCNA